MSITKHKIFQIKISEDNKFSLDGSIQKEINSFLSDSNNIYVNHSTSVLTQDVEEYGQNKTINKFLVISLIYKDLIETEYNLSNASKKIKKVVSKQIETGQTINEPNIETDFDREIKHINHNNYSINDRVSYTKVSTPPNIVTKNIISKKS